MCPQLAELVGVIPPLDGSTYTWMSAFLPRKDGLQENVPISIFDSYTPGGMMLRSTETVTVIGVLSADPWLGLTDNQGAYTLVPQPKNEMPLWFVIVSGS